MLFNANWEPLVQVNVDQSCSLALGYAKQAATTIAAEAEKVRAGQCWACMAG